MLVAIVTGIVIMLALFAILEFSTRQASRAGDVLQATQQGRGTLTRIIDELRSSCVSVGATPVLKCSTASVLWFENAFSESAIIPKTSAFQHKLFLAENEKGGTLWDWTYPATGGTEPPFTYTGSTPKQVVLSEDVSHAKTASGESIPIFQYYKYSTTPGAVEANKSVSTLTAMTPPAGEGFTAEEAKKVASVLVSFRAAPSDNSSAVGRDADFSGQATFAFSTPAAEATISSGPCQ